MARLPGPGRALRLLTGRSWPQLASLIGGSGQGRGQGGAGAGRGRVLTERAGGGERSRAERLPGRGCGRRGACGSPDGAEPAGGRAARGGRRRAVPSLAGWPLQGRACQLPSPPRRRRGPSAVRGRRAARDTKGARAAGAGLRRRPARPDGPAAPRGPGKVCGWSAGRPGPRGLRGASSRGRGELASGRQGGEGAAERDRGMAGGRGLGGAGDGGAGARGAGGAGEARGRSQTRGPRPAAFAPMSSPGLQLRDHRGTLPATPPPRFRGELGSRFCLGLSASGTAKRRAETLTCARNRPPYPTTPFSPGEGTCQPRVFKHLYVKVALRVRGGNPFPMASFLKRLRTDQLCGSPRSCIGPGWGPSQAQGEVPGAPAAPSRPPDSV